MMCDERGIVTLKNVESLYTPIDIIKEQSVTGARLVRCVRNHGFQSLVGHWIEKSLGMLLSLRSYMKLSNFGK